MNTRKKKQEQSSLFQFSLNKLIEKFHSDQNNSNDEDGIVKTTSRESMIKLDH